MFRIQRYECLSVITALKLFLRRVCFRRSAVYYTLVETNLGLKLVQYTRSNHRKAKSCERLDICSFSSVKKIAMDWKFKLMLSTNVEGG